MLPHPLSALTPAMIGKGIHLHNLVKSTRDALKGLEAEGGAFSEGSMPQWRKALEDEQREVGSTRGGAARDTCAEELGRFPPSQLGRRGTSPGRPDVGPASMQVVRMLEESDKVEDMVCSFYRQAAAARIIAGMVQVGGSAACGGHPEGILWEQSELKLLPELRLQLQAAGRRRLQPARHRTSPSPLPAGLCEPPEEAKAGAAAGHPCGVCRRVAVRGARQQQWSGGCPGGAHPCGHTWRPSCSSEPRGRVHVDPGRTP